MLVHLVHHLVVWA